MFFKSSNEAGVITKGSDLSERPPKRKPNSTSPAIAAILNNMKTLCTLLPARTPRQLIPVSASSTAAAAAPAKPSADAWLTPEGIAVKQAYSADDIAGLDFIDGYPGIEPFLRGPYPTMYVTQPSTIRQ